jgi:hypothetical protein
MTGWKIAALSLAAVGITSLGFAAKPADTVRLGAPQPNIVRSSTNTVINYAGGVPALYTGSLDAGDSTYNRGVTCAALSGVGTAVAFDTLTITNTLASAASFVVFSTPVGGGACPDPAGPDTFFTVYDTTFNAASPLTNCLAVNDDISAAANRCSQLTFSIPAGATRVVVTSAFDNASLATGLFNYQVNFTGTTPVELLGFSIE